MQAVAGALACVAVAWVWFRDTPAALKNAVLLLGTCLATPYLQDYDLVFGAIVVAWLWQQPVETDASERALQIACGLLLLLPLVAAALAHLTGLAFGPLFILPVFIVALQMSFGARPAQRSARHHRGYHQHNHNRAHQHQGQRVGDHVPDQGEARAFRQQRHAAMRALAGSGLAHVLVHRAGVDLLRRFAGRSCSGVQQAAAFFVFGLVDLAAREALLEDFERAAVAAWRPRIMYIIMNPQATIMTMKKTGPNGIHGPGP